MHTFIFAVSNLGGAIFERRFDSGKDGVNSPSKEAQCLHARRVKEEKGSSLFRSWYLTYLSCGYGYHIMDLRYIDAFVIG